MVSTTGPNDATRLARQAARGAADVVIICGGDGTINEALQGIVGTPVQLAVLPCGTANVLARELKLPFDARQIARLIEQGRTRRIHVGCATIEHTGARHYFLLMAGIGLDASVVRRVRPRLKRRVGEAAFWYSGLGHLAYWEPLPFHIEVGGESYPATFAAVGKAPHYGGGLGITPRARLDAPEFEVCISDSRSRLRYLYLLSHALQPGGVAETAAGVRFIRTAKARATGGSALVQIDGELIGELPMTFEIAPHTVEIVVP